jgi:hypothetical protein
MGAVVFYDTEVAGLRLARRNDGQMRKTIKNTRLPQDGENLGPHDVPYLIIGQILGQHDQGPA